MKTKLLSINTLLVAVFVLCAIPGTSAAQKKATNAAGKIKILKKVKGKTFVQESSLQDADIKALLDSVSKNADFSFFTDDKNMQGFKIKKLGKNCMVFSSDSLPAGFDMSFIYSDGDDKKTKKEKHGKKDKNEDEDFDFSGFDFQFKNDGGNLLVKQKDGSYKAVDTDDAGNVSQDETVIIEKDGKIIKKRTVIIISDPEKKDVSNNNALRESSADAVKLPVKNLSLFPNPGDGNFKLSFTLPESGDTRLTITDVNGKEVYRETLQNFQGDYEKQISLTEQAGGVYFLNIEQNGRQLVKKILKQ